jgi:hypothetical protein
MITVDTQQASNTHQNYHQQQHQQQVISTARAPNVTTAENFLNNIREAVAARRANLLQPNNNTNNAEEGMS